MKKIFLLLTVMLATTMGLLAQGTTWQTATLISSGATKSGSLDASHGEHWYKINVTTEGTINLTATTSGNLLLSPGSSYVAGVKNDNTYSRGSFSGTGYGSVTITYQATDAGKGTYYIRISRYNGEGSYTLKYTFSQCSVSNDSEPNNDYEHSSLLQSGTTVQGRLGYRTSDDVLDTDDWYKIVVPEEGHVELIVTATATATENLTLSTYSSVVYGLKSNGLYSRGNISAPGYSNDTITYQATDIGKGTYYIKINRYGGVGGYKLYYKFTPCSLAADPEPNNDYEHSSLLQSGKTVEGRLGHRTSDDVLDTDDWYKIVVTEEGKIELVVTATENLTLSTYSSVVYGLNSNGLYSRGNISAPGYSNDTITYQATDIGKGTYYIKINRYGGCGGYRLSYKFTPCSLAADPEPNNDYEHSSLLESGKTVEGRLGHRTSDDVLDTEDWYKIVVPEEGKIELVVTATENLTLSTYSSVVYGVKSDGATYSRGNISAPGYSNDTITYEGTDIGVGTYYIRINRYGGCGGYKLYYKFTPCAYGADPEPNNDYQHASRLPNGMTTEGRLGYRSSDDVTDNEDWYRINVPEDGPVEINVVGFDGLKFSGCGIYRIQNNSLSRISDFSGNYTSSPTYQSDNLTKGVYYIRISRYGGNGGYRINYNGPAIPGDVNNDGFADVHDIVVLIDYVLGNNPEFIDLTVSDLSGDGMIDVVDVVALIDRVLNGN
jgi:hypothetical protein